MTDIPVVTQLSPILRSDLLRTLTVRLSTDLTMRGHEHYPPGAVDYGVGFRVTWFPDPADEPDDNRLLESIAADGTEVDGSIEFEVGRAHLVKVDLAQRELFSALDDREADLGYLGGLLFSEHDDGGYEIENDLQTIDSDALLVNAVEIDPWWRGLRLGLLGTGTAIHELGRGCSFAALDAMQPGAKGETDRRTAHARLTRYWSRLGFEPWRQRVMVLDLATRSFGDKMAVLLPR